MNYGVKFEVVEINLSNNMSKIQDELQTISGIRTVPNLFIDGVSKGGCSDFKKLEFQHDQYFAF